MIDVVKVVHNFKTGSAEEFKDFKYVPVVGKEMKKISDILTILPSQIEPNPYKATLVYPTFKYISIDETDRVWIGNFKPIWTNKADKKTICDVFSLDGVFLFKAEIPGHVYPQLIFKMAKFMPLRNMTMDIQKK